MPHPLTEIFEDALQYVTHLHKEDANNPTYSHKVLISKRKKYTDANDWAEFERVVYKLLKTGVSRGE